MNTFDRFLAIHGIPFEIHRENQMIFEIDGIPNTEKSTGKRYVGFKPNTDIKANDFIINKKSGEKFRIIDTRVSFARKEPIEMIAYTISESEYLKNKNQQSGQPIFNIEEVHNSIIGTQQNAVIHNGYSIEDLTKLIEQHDSYDKELLKEMISVIDTAISNQEPVKKGFLSKFAGVLQRNEWITAPVATFFLEYFLSHK